jgi:RNA polymerase II subunit A-like phosphatase
MVCIIDDREDVWNYARNLVCVKPYVYFKNTGDINDPHAAAAGSAAVTNNGKRKRKLQPSSTSVGAAATASSSSSSTTASSSSSSSDTNETNRKVLNNDEESNSSTDSKSSGTSDADGSSPAPAAATSSTSSSSALPIHEDSDDYLESLGRILRKVHDEYYKIYEERLATRDRQAKVSGSDINEADLPDVKKVLPLLKSKILENCVITFSGVIPTGYDLKKQRCYLMATSLGAKVNENIVLAEDEEAESLANELSGAENNGKYVYKYDEEDDSISNSSGGADSKSSDSLLKLTADAGRSNNVNSSQNKERNEAESSKTKKRYTTHLVAVY